MVRKMLTTLALLALVLGIATFYRTAIAGKTPGLEAARLVEAGALLVDVRTPEEFSAGHLEGAVNVPLAELERRVADLGDPSRSIVLYCRSGARSGRAKRLLEQRNFTDVRDVGAMSRYGR